MANTNEMTAHEEHPVDGLYRLLTRTAVFGIEVQAGRVVRAAPYARAAGSKAVSVLERWQKRGATIEYLGA